MNEPPQLGSLLDGRYRLLRVLGTGGMGVVYETEDTTTGAKVAVKVLKSTLLDAGPFVERLRREAKAIAALAHPNIVKVFDVHIDRALAYLVMELLEGMSFGAFLKENTAPDAALVARIGCQILDALAFAHARGMVHRDVKPDNLFLVKDNTIRLLDFGLVKSAAETKQLTATGTVLGTWQYMAPEQANGLAVDGRADVYSAAACLYYALTKKRPYQAADMEASMFALGSVPAPPLASQRAGLDRAFAAAIDAALSKSVATRPTAEAFSAMLAPFASTSTGTGTGTGAGTGVDTAPTTERFDDISTAEQRPPSTARVPPPNDPAVLSHTLPLPRAQEVVPRGTERRRLLVLSILAILLFAVGLVVGRIFFFQ